MEANANGVSNPLILSASDVARRLRLSRSQVKRLAASGDIPSLGRLSSSRGAYVFDAATIARVAAERAAELRAEADAIAAAS